MADQKQARTALRTEIGMLISLYESHVCVTHDDDDDCCGFQSDYGEVSAKIETLIHAELSTALDRLTAKIQTYRARSINSSQASLLDALADDIAEERERVRGAKVATAQDHVDAGPGFTHHDHSACCPCPCRKGAA
ncbi:hypothetical protein G6024_14520 [Dietzia maris]|nr:hypothetical protein [Dietzia maris]MBB0998284.1 hypothetical protein [Dietzia maris]